jgi:hypothetical protein
MSATTQHESFPAPVTKNPPSDVPAPAPAADDDTDQDIPDSSSFFNALGLTKDQAEGKFAPIPGVDPVKDAEQTAKVKKPRATRKTALIAQATQALTAIAEGATQAPAAPAAPAGDVIPETGYSALGMTSEGGRGVLWSYYGNTVISFGPGDYFNKSKLMDACGFDYLMANHSHWYRGALTVNWEAAGAALNLATKKAGLYVESNVIGGGIRRVGDRIVVNGLDCFDAITREPVDRASPEGGPVFLRNHDLGIKSDQEPATADEAAKLLEAIGTWKWANGATDAMIVFGATMSAFITGYLDQRPHLMIHSPKRGCGKSALKKLQLGILGGACVARSDQGEAGLRQLFRKRAIAILLDEMGGEGDKRDKTWNYLKLGFDGEDGESKGSQDSSGAIDFEIRTMAIVYRLHAPELEEQVNSRFYFAGLKPYETEVDAQGRSIKSEAPKHELFPAKFNANAKEISALGKRLFARMLASIPRFEKTLTSLNDAFKAGARASDTLTPFIAAAYVAIQDDAITTPEQANAWIDEFDLEEELNRIENVQVDNNFEKAINSALVTVDVPNMKTKIEMRLDELMGHAAYDTKNGPFVSKLNNLGMRLRPETEKCQDARGNTVKVPVRNAEGVLQWQLCIEMPPVQAFKKLFVGSGFDENNLRGLIKSIPGASQKEGNPDIRFGPGSPSKYLTVPYVCPDHADLRLLATSAS